MARTTIVQIVSDDDGKVMLETATPPSAFSDLNPPHNIGIRTSLKSHVADQANAETWLVVERKDAYRLLQLLSDKLLEATEKGADEITSTLRFERVLTSGIVGDTGRIVLVFGGKSGLKYRVELPRDQTGVLVDLLGMAAKKAAEAADTLRGEAYTGVVKDEVRPLDADLIVLQFDPLTGNEVLNVRLPSGLEYSFALSAEQAQQLRSNRPLRR